MELGTLACASLVSLLGSAAAKGHPAAWLLTLLYPMIAGVLLWLSRRFSADRHRFLGAGTGAAVLVLAIGSGLGDTEPLTLTVRLWVFTVVYLGSATLALDWIERRAGLLPARSPAVATHSWQFAAKHALDRTVAGAMLLALAPLLMVIMLAVRLSSPGPAVFRQRRVGRDGTQFDLLKFRSMRIDSDQPEFAPGAGLAPGGIEGVDRRTRIGRLLRDSSLDELPQLVNVLRGEMSLIGPRPERPEFVERFCLEIPGYGDRHRVKAGITGWAQAHGLRGQTSIIERVAFDNHYIDNWSARLELRILIMTVIEVLGLGKGPNQGHQAPQLCEASAVAASAQRSKSSATDSSMALAA